MPRVAGSLAMIVLSALLAGCATTAALDQALQRAPVILFGEVHDNPSGHALRTAAIERHLARGARPAILMEHFDRERQGDIDRVLARPDASAAALIAAAGGRGWPWPQLEPVIELAIRHRLPIVAANLSRDDARRVMREGAAAAGLDPAETPAVTPAPVEAAQVQAIVAGHCGQIDAAAALPMARAQVARDRVMAQAIERHAERGAVLLAGNGHVRRDIGVPQWLSAATRARSVVIGLVESRPGTAAVASPYDVDVVAPAPARTDPCASLVLPPPRPTPRPTLRP